MRHAFDIDELNYTKIEKCAKQTDSWRHDMMIW